jgi:hypothetical protein
MVSSSYLNLLHMAAHHWWHCRRGGLGMAFGKTWDSESGRTLLSNLLGSRTMSNKFPLFINYLARQYGAYLYTQHSGHWGKVHEFKGNQETYRDTVSKINKWMNDK